MRIILWLLWIYIALCGFLYFEQDSLLYFPSQNQKLVDKIHSNANSDEFSIRTEEGKIVGRASGTGSCMIFYLGGNAENTDYHFARDRTWWKTCIFATMNYRGYWASTGKANESNIHEDSIHIFESMYAQYQPSTVYIVGRSLWTNPAIYLSQIESDRVTKLILITPYASMANVAQWHYPLFPARWLIKDDFDSASLAKNLNVETLILQASDDVVIPAIHTQKLIENFKIKPTVELIPGTNHNTITESPIFIEKIEEFLRKS